MSRICWTRMDCQMRLLRARRTLAASAADARGATARAPGMRRSARRRSTLTLQATSVWLCTTEHPAPIGAGGSWRPFSGTALREGSSRFRAKPGDDGVHLLRCVRHLCASGDSLRSYVARMGKCAALRQPCSVRRPERRAGSGACGSRKPPEEQPTRRVARGAQRPRRGPRRSRRSVRPRFGRIRSGSRRRAWQGPRGRQAQHRRTRSANELAKDFACDGQGACVAKDDQSCSPYACAGDVCATSCTTDPECAPGFICNPATHACEPAPAGKCLDDATFQAPDLSTSPCKPY